jgi:hypothetical protein
MCIRNAWTVADQSADHHERFEMVMARSAAIACGYEDANDLDRLRHDPAMKIAVGRAIPWANNRLSTRIVIDCCNPAVGPARHHSK